MDQTIEFFRSLIRAISFVFRKTDTAEICGHQTKRNPNKIPDFCDGCLRKMAARCAWCGRLIYFGDIVTLCKPSSFFDPPDYAVCDVEDPKLLVGCAHCTPIINNIIMGIWVHPGKIERFPVINRVSSNCNCHHRVEFDLADLNDLGRLVESDSDSTPL